MYRINPDICVSIEYQISGLNKEYGKAAYKSACASENQRLQTVVQFARSRMSQSMQPSVIESSEVS